MSQPNPSHIKTPQEQKIIDLLEKRLTQLRTTVEKLHPMQLYCHRRMTHPITVDECIKCPQLQENGHCDFQDTNPGEPTEVILCDYCTWAILPTENKIRYKEHDLESFFHVKCFAAWQEKKQNKVSHV